MEFLATQYTEAHQGHDQGTEGQEAGREGQAPQEGLSVQGDRPECLIFVKRDGVSNFI